MLRLQTKRQFESIVRRLDFEHYGIVHFQQFVGSHHLRVINRYFLMGAVDFEDVVKVLHPTQTPITWRPIGAREERKLQIRFDLEHCETRRNIVSILIVDNFDLFASIVGMIHPEHINVYKHEFKGYKSSNKEKGHLNLRGC